MEFEKKLRNLRVSNGMTREDLAEKSGIPLKLIISYEKGRRYPNHENMDKLCDALGIKEYQILTDVEFDEAEYNRTLQFRRIFIYATGGTAIAFLIAFIIVFSIYLWKGTTSIVSVFLLGIFAIISLAAYDVLIITLLKRRREKMALSISVNLLMILAASATFLINLWSFSDFVSYSKEKWLTISQEYKYYVAEDFLNKNNIIDMTTEQIKSYLDQPEIENGPDFQGYTFFVYECGHPVRKPSVDPYTLRITFHNNKVINYTFKDR
ncbi:MAG: helix-turn-helix domain-containing protein [Bacilli bacterium]|nr:helix-turn-helix domain-containing protein [Bacilli bacterium]